MVANIDNKGQILLESFKSFNSLDTEIAQAKGSIKQIERDRILAKEALAKRIRAGETTGDPIVDYVLCQAKEYRLEIANFYQDIEKRIKACQGQNALIVGNYQRDEDMALMFGSDYSGSKPDFYMGRISGEELILDLRLNTYHQPTVFIPTNDFYIKPVGGWQRFEKKLGNLGCDENHNLKINHFAHFDQDNIISILPECYQSVLLKIGKKEINNWLAGCCTEWRTTIEWMINELKNT